MLFEVIIFAISVISLVAALKINNLWKLPPQLQLKNDWWGPGQSKEVDTSIRPFKIEISQNVIYDLHQRLNNARSFTPPLEGIQQQYGMNTKLLSEIVEFWKTKYVWREREEFLNQLPQFKTNIQGLDIHFLHVKPIFTEDLKIVPILLIHGWPGSFREFYELIPLLTNPQHGKDFIFEVVAPSLPGFGFSDGASKPGLNPIKISLVLKNLMHRIGFNKFYVQGGDWGGIISSHMATLFPHEVLGAHLNFCSLKNVHPVAKIEIFLNNLWPSLMGSGESKTNMFLKKINDFALKEGGYRLLQATKPDTVGVALNDSPVGLAAYILEKFTTWTNPSWVNREDGGLLEKYSYTKLLDNVMIYWITNSITTSCRIYYERSVNVKEESDAERTPAMVPVACARYEHEIFYQPDEVLKYKYPKLLHVSDIPNGGHFAAFEEPEVFAKDVWEAFSKFLDYYK